MVLYTCKNCEKTFIDKTKYTIHLNKKKPCIAENDGKDKKEDELNEAKNKIHEYLSKYGVEKKDLPTNLSLVDKNSNYTEKEIDELNKFFSSTCRLCKKKYDDTYINHLVNHHKIRKEEHNFSFVQKTSGIMVYEDYKECGDVVLLTFEDNKALYFTTKNLHNLQRHKKEKYRDIEEFYYYPCKDIKTFKAEFTKKCKSLGINEDEKNSLKVLESIINEILCKVNKNTDKDNERTKVTASYRTKYYYKCPFCNYDCDEKDGLQLHLIETHKYLKHNAVFSIDDEQEEKIINMIENNSNNNKMKLDLVEIEEVRCDYCNNIFSSKFNLRRHLKMNCKKYQLLVQNNLIKDNDELKEDLFKLIENNEKLRKENKILKETLVGNQEIIKDQNEVLKNSVNYFTKTTNIIQNNNILFNINDFGNEDISHIDKGFIEGVIKQMSTNSLVKFIEEVHYGNPQNCNVIIPTNIPAIQDNNLLLLKRGDRWVLDKKKNVIDDMLTMNIDRIADAYEDLQPKLSNLEKSGFEEYVTNMENMNENGVRNNAIDLTEELIKSKQPNNFLLENLRVQQNNFIEGSWKDSVDYQIPQKMIKIENMDNNKINEFMEKPIVMDLGDNLKI